MFKSALSLITCLFVIAVLATPVEPAAAQSMPVHVQPPLPTHPGPVARAPHPHQPPCWQEAGISKSAMAERGAIQRRTRAEVEAVCAQPLTPQQRREKIRQIHEQAQQEMDALVTPQQMQALKSCQMSRNHGGGHAGLAHPSAGGGHGPCGELPSGSHPTNPPRPSPGGKPEPEIDN